MAAKTEAKDSKDPNKDPKGVPPAAEKGSPAELTAPAAPSGPGFMAWVPALVAVIVGPVVTFAVAQYVLIPRFQQKLAAGVAGHAADGGNAPAAEEAPPKAGKEGKEASASDSYEFSNVVVNLAGTMGTRYLKASFVVTSADKKINVKAMFEAQKAKLIDVTLNVLSSLSLADLEEPGAKNVLREKLVGAYNQAFDKQVVDQVYFSDFVVQ